LHFISSSAFTSNKFIAVENHLQFNGNDSRRVGKVGFEQAIVHKAIDQWRKRFRAFMKAKAEHFKHWL